MSRPGVRPGLHEPNLLRSWVFFQHQVWVDRHGTEHEIESMSPVYARNVIAFCERQSARIAALVMIDLAEQVLRATARGDVDGLDCCAALLGDEDMSPDECLAATPLMRSLRRRVGDSG